MSLLLALSLLMLFVAPAQAGDGVLEINQTCAVQTGCFPGDTAGFPVTITQPGSYALTSNLDLSAEGVNVSGVAVSTPAVTIDLRGFQIAGATSCSGSGASINCSPSSTGVGSAGVQFTINATAGVVRGGIVRNMTNFGILSQATGLHVQDVTAIQNGRDGITGGQGSLVVNSVAIENGQDGIDVNTGSVVDGVTAIGNGSNGIRGQGTASVVTRTSVRNNGMRRFFLGLQYKFGKNNVSSANGEADQWCGGLCTSKRRVYVTKNKFRGATALSACTLGFHMATKSELFDISGYDYDTELALDPAPASSDSGLGPPYAFGAWVRGSRNNNCNTWSTSSSGVAGTILVWAPSDTSDSITNAFAQETYLCVSELNVWCAEDR
jgi:hypothetical protein